MTEKQIGEYSVHVCEDGEEILFQQLPEQPDWPHHWMRLLRHHAHAYHVHYVIALELADGSRIEQTTLPTIKTRDFRNTIICPKPHGTGWKVYNNDSDNFTVFRRQMPTNDRRKFGGLGEWLRECA